MKVANLTPETEYDVAIYKTDDGEGSTGATGTGATGATSTLLDPPKFDKIVTDENGFGFTGKLARLTSDFAGLDQESSYNVKVTSEDGTVVLAGDLESKWRGKGARNRSHEKSDRRGHGHFH